jgi:hypothetical protein
MLLTKWPTFLQYVLRFAVKSDMFVLLERDVVHCRAVTIFAYKAVNSFHSQYLFLLLFSSSFVKRKDDITEQYRLGSPRVYPAGPGCQGRDTAQ